MLNSNRKQKRKTNKTFTLQNYILVRVVFCSVRVKTHTSSSDQYIHACIINRADWVEGR